MDIFCLNHSTQHRSILFSPCWGFSIENCFLDSFPTPPSFCDAYCLEQDFNMVKMKIFFFCPHFFFTLLCLVLLQPIWCSPPLGKGSPQVALTVKNSAPPLLCFLLPFFSAPLPFPSFFSAFSLSPISCSLIFPSVLLVLQFSGHGLQKFDENVTLETQDL